MQSAEGMQWDRASVRAGNLQHISDKASVRSSSAALHVDAIHDPKEPGPSENEKYADPERLCEEAGEGRTADKVSEIDPVRNVDETRERLPEEEALRPT